MSSYGSAHSGQLQPGYHAPAQLQRSRSYSNPPYPITPNSAPCPQHQSSYFPPATAPHQQAPPTSNPIAIPASNRERASSDYTHGYATAPSYPQASSPYATSYPTQHLQPIPQQQPMPDSYHYSPQQQPAMSSSPSYSHHRRHSSSSHHAHNSRQSYESTSSFQSAQSHNLYPAPDHYARYSQNGTGNSDDRYNYGNENEGHGAVRAYAEPLSRKDYGDWDKNEVREYQKNRDLERRPTLGGSLMSFVKKIGGNDRR